MAFETAMLVGAGTSAAGAAVSGISSYQTGRSQQALANYNAKLSEIQAQREMEMARIESRDLAKQGALLKGKQRAAFAKAGVGGQTPLALAMQTASDVALDRARVQAGGSAKSQYAISQAGVERMQGSQAAKSGLMGLGSSLLEGAGGAISSYGDYKYYKSKD